MRRTIIRRLTVMAATALATLAFASPAWAATFTVTKTADTNDGACNADCSLREAVRASNILGQSDTIEFAPGVRGAITLNPALGGISILNGSTQITSLTIDGPGAGALAVSGGDAVRPFEIGGDARATINGLTIRNGKADVVGGGIYNDEGTLTLNDSTVSGNKAIAGGGIYNYNGTLTLNRSSVTGNDADIGGGGISSYINLTNRATTIKNSTISDNTADSGGGIFNSEGLTRIENSTITKNTAPPANGSGVASFGPSFGPTFIRTEVFSSIVSANANTDVDFVNGATNTFLSTGYNLIGDGNATAAFNKDGDRTGVANPGLGPLRNNGGPTRTHALLGNSPALDKGTNIDRPATDQRGVIRPQRGTCDIGSFERRNAVPIARNDFYRGVKNRLLVVPGRGVLRNDTDAEGDVLRATRLGGPMHGRLTLRPNGSFTYSPKRNFSGVVRFVYRASDGRGGVDNATATIWIRARP